MGGQVTVMIHTQKHRREAEAMRAPCWIQMSPLLLVALATVLASRMPVLFWLGVWLASESVNSS